ncbi:hypothetical protein [Alteriqipengyuania sp. 357]
MTENSKIDSAAAGNEKPKYLRPEMTELDAAETAVGVVVGSPENVSYIS